MKKRRLQSGRMQIMFELIHAAHGFRRDVLKIDSGLHADILIPKSRACRRRGAPPFALFEGWEYVRPHSECDNPCMKIRYVVATSLLLLTYSLLSAQDAMRFGAKHLTILAEDDKVR